MRGWSITQWIISIIVTCGVVAIMLIALPAMGIVVPVWAVSMMWVVVVVVCAIAAIGLIAAVWRSWFGGGPGP